MDVAAQIVDMRFRKTYGINQLVYSDSTDWGDRTAATNDFRCDEHMRFANQPTVKQAAQQTTTTLHENVSHSPLGEFCQQLFQTLVRLYRTTLPDLAAARFEFFIPLSFRFRSDGDQAGEFIG